jgi:hypothetical protein
MKWPITVAAQAKAWTVFARSSTGIMGSNPTQGMNVCVRLFCVCVALCVGRGVATGWFPVQGVLPTVYRIKKLKKPSRSNKKDCRVIGRLWNVSCKPSAAAAWFRLLYRPVRGSSFQTAAMKVKTVLSMFYIYILVFAVDTRNPPDNWLTLLSC